MPENDIKTKLKLLAKRVKQDDLTFSETTVLNESFDNSTGTVYTRTTEAIAKALGESREHVLEKLASFDDTDSIIDDIVDVVKKDR